MTLDIDRRATHWANRPAVVDHTDGETLDYSDLADRADRTARRLAGAGVESGDSVAVLSRNRVELLALFFGARRLGATLAPISQRLPPETVGALADRIDPALALHEPQFAELAGVTGAETGTFDDWATAEEADVGEETDRDERADTTTDSDAAHPSMGPAESGETPPLYLHTGGTTGIPKVVVVSERQVEWNCITEAAAWGLGKDTVSPVLLPMFHTGGWLLLTLPTLYVGGRVVLQREFDPGEALELVERHGATQVFAVAAIFGVMADHPDFAETDFSTVEWFMSGGGPTPDAVMAAFRDRGETFVQGYGLTEGGPNNLYVDPSRPDAHDVADTGVGRPFPDCRARIVDDDGTVLGPDVVGELEVAGPVTAERYLETTDGTFSGNWVSTGDLAKRTDEGDYTIVGRTDNMFVSGGENVYPERIESVLERHDSVAAAGVIPAEHDRWGQVPKAIVVPAGDTVREAGDTVREVGDTGREAFDAEDLEAFAREYLAGYEVPSTFAVADELPMSGPGKLDRAALREVYQ